MKMAYPVKKIVNRQNYMPQVHVFRTTRDPMLVSRSEFEWQAVS